MSVAYELKQKRAALIDRLQQLERERVDEPDFQASLQPGSGRGDRPRKAKPSSSEVKAAMNGINKRQAVLEVLREAGEPISVTDCATKFASKLGIPSEPQNLSGIAHRLSAVLTQLTTARRVRQSGQFDGPKVLWEVAA
jgi:hypothetical protein